MMRMVVSFIICIVITLNVSSCAKDSGVSSKYNFEIEYMNNIGDYEFTKEYIMDISDKTYQFIDYIKEKNTDGIVKLCYDGNLMYDSRNEWSVTKKQLLSDFKKKGEVYQLFFNSDLYYKSDEEYINNLSDIYEKEDYRLCLRDVLLKYDDIRIRKIQIWKADRTVTVYLTWKSKEKSQSGKISYSISFDYENDKWMLSTLLLRN
jgi:hypothetical protein